MGDIINFWTRKKIEDSEDIGRLRVIELLEQWHGLGLSKEETVELKKELEYYLNEVIDALQNDFE